MSKKTVATQAHELGEQEQRAVAVTTGGAAREHNLRNIGLIVGREYKNRVIQRSFVISTIIILILVVIGACVPTIIAFITSSASAPTRMAVVNNAGSIGGLNNQALLSYIGTTLNGPTAQAGAKNTPGQNGAKKPLFAVSLAEPGALNSLKKQVRAGNLNILLLLNRSTNRDVHFIYYTSSSATGDPNVAKIQALAAQLNILDKASRLGLTAAQTGSLFTQADFTLVSSGQKQDSRSTSDIIAGYIIAYAGIILIFMSVFLYGMGVATGVAEEKGSRIMEILVNAATPFQLMVGKIVGIGAAGLTQMACFVVVGIGALLLQNPLKAALLGDSSGGFNLNFTATSITLLLLLLVYFILGFLLYATLFAAMGALVKRQDEVQNAVQPLTWLFMVGYIVSFIGISSPDATWVRVISYIPFWTPTTMLMRIGAAGVAWWEIALTIVLMLIAIFICALISARIYRFGILMYGQRPGLAQLVKLLRMQ